MTYNIKYIIFIIAIIITQSITCKSENEITNKLEIDNPFSISEEAFILNEKILSEYLQIINNRKMNKSEYIRFNIHSAIPNLSHNSDLYLLDSAKFEKFRTFLIMEHIGSEQRVWLINYTSNDNKPINNRKVYDNEEIYEKNIKIYSYLNIPEKEIILYECSYRIGEMEIPIIIHNNGIFEEFPDIYFSLDTIAISSCTGEFFGKLPLKQSWTVVNFEENKIKRAETQINCFDCIKNLSTEFTSEKLGPEYFDIAFKGIYDRGDIEMLQMQIENPSDYKDVIELARQNFLQEYKNYAIEDSLSIELYSFTNNEEKFWIINCSFNVQRWSYNCIFGVDSNNNISSLANICANPFYLFRLKKDIFLYTSKNSCGEGAYGDTYLYKLENGFKKIFEKGRGCD